MSKRPRSPMLLTVTLLLSGFLILPAPGARAADAPRTADTLPIVTQADGSRTLKCLDHSPSLAEALKLRDEREELMARKDGFPSVEYPVTIDVVWHTIYGFGDLGRVTIAQVQAQISVLNTSFSGSGITFALKSLDEYYSPNWAEFDMGFGYYDEWDMKTSRVDIITDPPASTLHVYSVASIYDHDFNTSGILGFSVFPWDADANTVMDGIVLIADSMPHGSGYAGDTLVHEFGHYLGLYHTFESHGTGDGCWPGDHIFDTNAEASPNYDTCNEYRDTCPDDLGYDPVRNFMDYSPDSCMDHFTPDQITEMKWNLEIYRTYHFPLVYTLSGTVRNDSGVGLAGVSMGGLEFDGRPVVTGAGGGYTGHVEGGASVAVIPSLANYTFTPASRVYTDFDSDLTGQDYTGVVAPDFVDATPPVAVFGTNEPTSIVVGDFDADGLQDLAVTFQAGTGLAVYENNGAGSYVEHVLYVNWPEGTSLTVAAGDFGNDGDQDLYLTHDEGLKIFRNDGNMSFTEIGAPATLGQGRCSLVDYNNDGRLDFFNLHIGDWRQSVLFKNTPSGLIDVTPAGLYYDHYTQYRNAWGDYDDDGDQDLYVAVTNTQGLANRLLRNDGPAGFTELLGSDVADLGESRGVEWVDYDGDGRLDLSVTNQNGACRLFRNLGGDTFVDVAAGPLAANDDTRAAAWGDYDNDGDLDVYLCRFSYDTGLGHNVLLRQESDGTFVDSGIETDANSMHTNLAVWTDHDADGDLDLIVLNRGSEASFLYENDRMAAGNHWLRVNLEGTASNRDGVGARIYLTTAGGQQTREITAGGNSLGQEARIAHFGLGGATGVTGLEVHWPSGIVQDVLAQGSVGIDRTVDVTEPNHRVTATIVRGTDVLPVAGNRFVGCPAGDGWDELVVEIDFDDAAVAGVPSIAPGDVELDMSGLALSFCGAPYNDEAGTPGNGYTVVLRRMAMSGCSACPIDDCTDMDQYGGNVPVSWLGVPVGRIAEFGGTSADMTGDGVIDLSDLSMYAQQHGLSEDDPGWNGCADLVPSGNVDLSDLSYFARHLGHSCGGAKSVVHAEALPVGGSRVTFQRRLGAATGDRLQFEVVLETGGEAGVVAFNLAADLADPGLRFVAWQPVSGGGSLSIFTRIDVDGRTLGQVTGIVPKPDDATRIPLGILELESDTRVETKAGEAAVNLAFGSILTGDGVEKSLLDNGAEGLPQITRSRVVRVYPNPFNPTTTIEYSVAKRSHVKIRIYDISGRLVRTLVDEMQEANSSLRNVRWTGTDASGRSVSSGVYFWRFSAGDQVQTGRALLLK